MRAELDTGQPAKAVPDSPGKSSDQARVTTRVVIKALSAAGSSMEPRTDLLSHRLASQPSS